MVNLTGLHEDCVFRGYQVHLTRNGIQNKVQLTKGFVIHCHVHILTTFWV